MNEEIKKELEEFQQYHKKPINVLFHIFCGFLFMTFFFLLFKKYEYISLSLYTLFLLFTLQKIILCIIIFLGLFVLLVLFKKYNFTLFSLIFLFFVFYFLSSVSHYLTNEPTILNMQELTLYKIFINTFYFIPFSVLSLYFIPNNTNRK